MLKKEKTRTPDSQPPAETFSSQDVTRITGVSLRQLQWWDEQGVVSPIQRGHKRLYQLHEVVEVSLISELRRKGISLRKIRRVLKYLKKEMGNGLLDSLRNGRESHLLTDGKNVYIENDHSQIVNILSNANQPMISVCMSDQVKRLSAAAAPLKKTVKSETRSAAQARATRAS
jgi:DNA-binding transcriptional MerR regulator